MAFYEFKWRKKDGEPINNINAEEINTEKINQYVKPDIKKENDNKKDEIDENVLILAVKHFIDTSFKKDSDINKMGYERTDEIGGEVSYNYPGIITDMITGNYIDIQNQRFIEKPSMGFEKSIPLSFYFDVSGSMYNYTDLLARISFLLLQNGISIIFGFNNWVNGVVLADEGIKTIEELKKRLTEYDFDNEIVKKGEKDLSEFLTNRKAEKCVIFSDFDPYKDICKLSEKCKVYWLCFEKRYNHTNYDFRNFNGNVYYTDSFESMKNHFVNMDNYDYVERQKKLILDVTSRRKDKNGKH